MRLFEQANEVCNNGKRKAFQKTENAIINPTLPAPYIPTPTTSHATPPPIPSPLNPLYFLLFFPPLSQAPHPATYAVDQRPVVLGPAAAALCFLFFLLIGRLDTVPEAGITVPLTCWRFGRVGICGRSNCYGPLNPLFSFFFLYPLGRDGYGER